MLLYYLFERIIAGLRLSVDVTTRRLLALTAVGIWLLHPLNVSTVLYAVQRMAQLSALFVVAGLLVFYALPPAVGGGRGNCWRSSGCRPVAGVAHYFCSPFEGKWCAVALADSRAGSLHFSRRLGGSAQSGASLYRYILLLLPIGLVFLLLALTPESPVGGYARREFTLEERLLTQPRLLWRYLGWIVIPNINDMGFQHDDIPLSTRLFSPVTTMLALLGWGLTLAVGILLRRLYPLLLLAVLFFLVGHSMESTLIPLEMVYEHRNYLPGMLVCMALAALIVLPASRSKKLSVWYPIAGAISVVALLLFIRVHALVG